MKTLFSFVICAMIIGLGRCSNRPAGQLVPFEEEGKWGFIDRTGRVIKEPMFDDCQDFEFNGLASVNLGASEKFDGLGGGKWGLIDTTGNIKIPIRFDGVSSYHDGVAAVKISERWGLADTTGRIIRSAIHNYPIFGDKR